MKRWFRSVFGCSNREIAADEMVRRQAEDHAIAMQAAQVRLNAAKFEAGVASRTSERAAQALLRGLQEDINGTR